MPPYFVPDWVKAAQNRAGTGGIAIGHFDKLGTMQIPSAASRVEFRANTTIGLLPITRSTFNERDLGALGNFLLRVTRHNHHLSTMIVHLGCLDTSTVCKGLEDNIPRMKDQDEEEQGGGGVTAETTDNEVFVAPGDTDIVFAETKPRMSKEQGYEPMGYNQRCYKIRDAQCVRPVHPLPTTVGLQFEVPHHAFRITTPIVYTAPATNLIPVPLLCPLPWVGQSEAVVLGPKIAPAVENTSPQALEAACLRHGRPLNCCHGHLAGHRYLQKRLTPRLHFGHCKHRQFRLCPRDLC